MPRWLTLLDESPRNDILSFVSNNNGKSNLFQLIQNQYAIPWKRTNELSSWFSQNVTCLKNIVKFSKKVSEI